MMRWKLVAMTVATELVLGSVASAYYHYVHYTMRTAPFTPIVEKFDLNALVNKTVPFYVSEQGPMQLAPNDSFAALLSQIRLAARTWNDVPTSDLRLAFGGLAFGGLATPGTPQNSPGIDIVFDEVPPGLVAVGGPTARAEMVSGQNGPSVPILRSVVILRRDLTQRPSYSEAFFLTMVHELGHALGLQHTLTSSVMSTEITRATTKSKPLAADDVAGISLLYPAAGFAASTGTVTGRVVLGSEGVNLASVVALSPQGPVVSTLTSPDGTYRIEGLPAGQYYLYVHPLPPALPGEVTPANVVLPLGADQQPLSAGPSFETQFYPGVKDPQQAVALSVSSGLTLNNVSFSVQPRGAPAVYAVQTYSFPGQLAVKPAYMTPGGSRSFVVAAGFGLAANSAPTSGLGVSVIGGAAILPAGGLRAYAPAPAFVQMDFQFHPLSGEGPRHLLFSLDNDIYVLPSAFYMVNRQPPFISGLASIFDAGGNRVVAVSGTNLFADTRILFDGLAGTVRGIDEFGRLLVIPPPASGGHRAAVVALNNDGQSSLFLQGGAPPTFDYDLADFSTFTLNPPFVAAGTEAMVEINGSNTNFVDGLTTLGFGSSDIRVRRLWVVSPSRILANVVVPGSASQVAVAVPVTVTTGLRILTQSYAFQVLPFSQRRMVLNPAVVDASTGAASVSPGSMAVVRVSQFFPEQSPNLFMTLNERLVPVLSASQGQVSFQIPPDMQPGPAVLRLFAGAETPAPVVISVDPLPPKITAVLVLPNTVIDAIRPARPGELLNLVVSGLGDLGAAPSSARLKITVGGIEHQPQQVIFSGQAGIYHVQFVLGTTVTTGTQTLAVSIDGRGSVPFFLPVYGF